MADNSSDRHDATKDDPERKPGIAGGAPSLAEEADIAFGAMTGTAVIIAVLVSMLGLAGFFGYQQPTSGSASATTVADHDGADEDEDDDHGDEDEEPAEEEAAVEELAEEEEAAPDVASAEATVDASPDGIVLTGTVPSQEVAEDLHAAAVANGYSEDQIDDQLVVEDGVDPFNLTINGSLNSAGRLDGLTEAVDGLGLGSSITNNLELSEGGSIVAALNELVELEPILFESGTAVIVADSQATLDEAAEILQGFPDAAIEVGGHTDSRGNDASNLSLSQLRADAVVAALQERGVTNELTPVGFGETELKEDPDDTAEQQQINRRIEFTVL